MTAPAAAMYAIFAAAWIIAGAQVRHVVRDVHRPAPVVYAGDPGETVKPVYHLAMPPVRVPT